MLSAAALLTRAIRQGAAGPQSLPFDDKIRRLAP
jgi:hypothetical protein